MLAHEPRKDSLETGISEALTLIEEGWSVVYGKVPGSVGRLAFDLHRYGLPVEVIARETRLPEDSVESAIRGVVGEEIEPEGPELAAEHYNATGDGRLRELIERNVFDPAIQRHSDIGYRIDTNPLYNLMKSFFHPPRGFSTPDAWVVASTGFYSAIHRGFEAALESAADEFRMVEVLPELRELVMAGIHDGNRELVILDDIVTGDWQFDLVNVPVGERRFSEMMDVMNMYYGLRGQGISSVGEIFSVTFWPATRIEFRRTDALRYLRDSSFFKKELMGMWNEQVQKYQG